MIVLLNEKIVDCWNEINVLIFFKVCQYLYNIIQSIGPELIKKELSSQNHWNQVELLAILFCDDR